MTRLITGDCLDVMPTLEANSVDSVICDPPYGLDFMGKAWDHGVPGVEFWQAALRVAKPGAILMAFGGTRTYHRLTCAIEDAGWEIRDCMMWLYGSGFPKSLDISKAIDKEAGAEREVVGRMSNPAKSIYSQGEKEMPQEVAITTPATPADRLWSGYGTALKPAWEPIIVAMKPLDGTYAANAQKWGVAGLNIDGGRIGTAADCNPNDYDDAKRTAPKFSGTFNGGKVGQYREGIGKVPNGRWPANLLLDEDTAKMLDEQSGISKSSGIINRWKDGAKPFGGGAGHAYESIQGIADFGGASRFFYTAKASPSERNAGLEDMPRVVAGGMEGRQDGSLGHITMSRNFHPTVKPVDLMRYLCKLTKTPTGGVVLDPFMGSGTTGIACVLEHRDFIGIELSAEYAEIARKRIADMNGPLFAEAA